MDRLSALLDASDEAHTAAIQSALIRTSGATPADRRYGTVAGYMKASETPARYYPVLAQSGTQEAVASLLDGFRSGNRDAAFAALLTVENPAMTDILYGIAAENPMLTDRALMRYADLASQAAVTPDPPLPALQTGSRSQAFGRRAANCSATFRAYTPSRH